MSLGEIPSICPAAVNWQLYQFAVTVEHVPTAHSMQYASSQFNIRLVPSRKSAPLQGIAPCNSVALDVHLYFKLFCNGPPSLYQHFLSTCI